LEKAMPRLTADVQLATARADTWSSAPAVFPAVSLLEGTLSRGAEGTRLLGVLMPTYLPQGRIRIAPDACKAAVASVFRKRGEVTLDFMVPSAWTTNATNFWDRLHFRQAIAEILPRLMREGLENRPSEDGLYQRLE